MSGLADLYQEVILDHNKRPRNQGRLEDANHRAEGYNPLCGDRLTLWVQTDDGGRVTAISFEGHGCAISTASASLLTEVVRGKTVAEARELIERFHRMLTGDPSSRPAPDPGLGKLQVFAGVREFPVRVKCATLAWHTLRAALEDRQQPVTTE